MNPNEQSDEELMLRVQADDAAAYQALFERHRASVHGFLLRMTGQPEEAAELFQETWLKVHRARGTFATGMRFRPWLFSIAANTRRDHGRRSLRSVDTVHIEVDLPAPRGVPAERITLERAIAALPDHLREAFLLGAVHGYDHNDLAEALGISPDNARARVSRARAALRAALEGSE